MKLRLRPSTLALLLVSCAGPQAPSTSPAAPAAARAWEHERSDLAVDPVYRFGHFENGLRWAWAANGDPKERSYLRLHVNAGSLVEEESELGMAHFLEHMAFNGSEHFPAGTLVEWFQRHGMAFGADLNASTDFGETIFKLDLPTSDAKTIDEGLVVLADFAFGMSLAPAEIEAEKGVIDGEERERDSASYRMFVRQLHTLLGSTRLDDRIPIGTRAVRAAFDAPKLGAFYRRWYRPENMTLVLVGDLGALDPVALFAQHFADVPRPSEPLAVDPGPGTLGEFPKRVAITEPEIPSVTLSIQHLRAWEDEPDDAAVRRERIPLSVARQMLDLRFAELAKTASAPFLSIDVGSAEALDVCRGEELTITCAPERWREALAAGEQGLRRALEHGFQEAELAEVRANALRFLDEAVERARTRSSDRLASELLSAAEERYVPISPEVNRALLAPVYAALTPEICRAALAEAWSKGELVLASAGKLDLGPDVTGALDQAWTASVAVAVEDAAAIGAERFAYSAGDEPGAIAERRRVEDLDFTAVRFANGVAFDVKQTDFKDEQIVLQARLGEGRLSLALDDQVLAFLADRVFAEGGLAAHSVDDLRRLCAGKQVNLRFGVDEDTCAFSGATTADDLLFELELLCAYLRAPGWREDGMVQLSRGLPLFYESLEHLPQGPFVTSFMSELLGDDARFVFPARAAVEARTLDEVRAWLDPELADAPLEVALVGDLDVEQAIAAAARTLGRLPPRRAPRAYAEHRVAPGWKDGVAQEHAIETQVPKSLVVLAFPVPDGIEIERARRLDFLGTVVGDRLRLELRERLGMTYSPETAVEASRTYPGFGMFLLQALTAPDEAAKVKDACLAVTDALAEKGVTDEEVERLRAPMLESLRDARRRNEYWVARLVEAQCRPAVLDEMRSSQASLEHMDAASLSALASAHLTRAHVASVVVNPKAGASGDAAATEKKD